MSSLPVVFFALLGGCHLSSVPGIVWTLTDLEAHEIARMKSGIESIQDLRQLAVLGCFKL